MLAQWAKIMKTAKPTIENTTIYDNSTYFASYTADIAFTAALALPYVTLYDPCIPYALVIKRYEFCAHVFKYLRVLRPRQLDMYGNVQGWALGA